MDLMSLFTLPTAQSPFCSSAVYRQNSVVDNGSDPSLSSPAAALALMLCHLCRLDVLRLCHPARTPLGTVNWLSLVSSFSALKFQYSQCCLVYKVFDFINLTLTWWRRHHCLHFTVEKSNKGTFQVVNDRKLEWKSLNFSFNYKMNAMLLYRSLPCHCTSVPGMYFASVF